MPSNAGSEDATLRLLTRTRALGHHQRDVGVILFFPVVILILSLIQSRLEKRSHARMADAKRRAASEDLLGGW